MVETRSGIVVDPDTTPETYMKGVGAPAETRTVQVRAGGIRRGGRPRGRIPLSHAQMYSILALMHGFLAIPLLFASKTTAKWQFGSAAYPVEDQHSHLNKLYASGLATSASLLLALSELAHSGLSRTYTADVLKVGAIGHGISSMLLLVLYGLRTTTFAWSILEGGAAALTALIPATQLLTSEEDRTRFQRDLKVFPTWLRGVLTFSSIPRRRYSWLATLYSILALNMFMAGASYFVAPRWSLYHTFGYDYGSSTHYMWRLIGLGALMTIMPSVLMALKHKADIQRMGATPARTLNLGLVGTSIGHLLVLTPIATKLHGGMLMPVVLGTWSAALVTSMLGLAAPEVQEMAEQVVDAAQKTQ